MTGDVAADRLDHVLDACGLLARCLARRATTERRLCLASPTVPRLRARRRPRAARRSNGSCSRLSVIEPVSSSRTTWALFAAAGARTQALALRPLNFTDVRPQEVIGDGRRRCVRQRPPSPAVAFTLRYRARRRAPAVPCKRAPRNRRPPAEDLLLEQRAVARGMATRGSRSSTSARVARARVRRALSSRSIAMLV